MKCSKCKKNLKEKIEQIGVNEQNIPILAKHYYCTTCSKLYSEEEALAMQPKKDSSLSIWAAFLSLFTFSYLIGGFLAIIDLSKKDKTKKHTGSWFALVFCVIYLIMGMSSCNEDSNTSTTSTIQSTQKEVAVSEKKDELQKTETATETETPISDKEILFMDIPWGTSFTDVDKSHGELDLWGITGEGYMTYSVDEIILGDYQGIEFEYDDINIIGNAFNGETEVAGYTTSEVSLYFAYNIVDGKLNKIEEESSLYGARYVFLTENLQETSNDLKQKITSIYGEPQKETTDTDIYDNQYTYTYWYGQNSTVLVMKTQNSENDTTDLYEDEITLAYAWLKGDELLQSASDYLKEEAIEKEQENYGNENTDGL